MLWLDPKVSRSELIDRVRPSGSLLCSHRALMKKTLLEAVRLLVAYDTRAQMPLPGPDAPSDAHTVRLHSFTLHLLYTCTCIDISQVFTFWPSFSH